MSTPEKPDPKAKPAAKQAPKPEPNVRRIIAVAALKIAEAYAAAPITEIGGNNRGDQVEFYQRLMGGSPGDPWCADFVSTCLVKAYARVHELAEDREHLPRYVHACGSSMIALSGYCPAIAAAAHAEGLLNRRADYYPEPGDLVLFDFEHEGEPHHIGIVRSWKAAQIYTVEGNTAPPAGPGSQADGDGVFLRVRPRGVVYGFVAWG